MPQQNHSRVPIKTTKNKVPGERSKQAVKKNRRNHIVKINKHDVSQSRSVTAKKEHSHLQRGTAKQKISPLKLPNRNSQERIRN